MSPVAVNLVFLWHAHIISSKVYGLNQISKLWTRNSQNKVECMVSWANSADMRKVNKTKITSIRSWCKSIFLCPPIRIRQLGLSHQFT
jgi:hypothetical protein